MWNHIWIVYVQCQTCTASLTVIDSVSCCCGIGRSSIISDISGPVMPLSPSSSLMKAANGSRAPSAGRCWAAWSNPKSASSWESGDPSSRSSSTSMSLSGKSWGGGTSATFGALMLGASVVFMYVIHILIRNQSNEFMESKNEFMTPWIHIFWIHKYLNSYVYF